MESQKIGYLKYKGQPVKNGYLDTRKSADAILGFDTVIRYVLAKEDEVFLKEDFELPIKISEGSWEMSLGDVTEALFSLKGIASVIAIKYGSSLAKKGAEDGFLESGMTKDAQKILKGALISVQWVIKIGSHVGGMGKNNIGKPRFYKGSDDIGVPNVRGEYMRVPKKFFDIYTKCPKDLLSKNAGIITDDLSMEVGVSDGKRFKKVVITNEQRSYFYKEEDKELETVLPQLQHGEQVVLEGEVTRINEVTNTIGFRFEEHILVCRPKKGFVMAQFKESVISNAEDHFFPKVKIEGIVDRMSNCGKYKERKPQIIFSIITPLEKINENHKLL